MTASEQQPDPRPALRDAYDWDASLIGATRLDQFDGASPCEGWSVRDVIRHMVTGLQRVAAMGEGRDIAAIPSLAGVADDELAAAYRAARDEVWRVWDEDALLDKEFVAPWGSVTGAQFLAGQTVEAVGHGWDLAVATGQDSEGPADSVQVALSAAQATIPAAGRAERPFGEVREVAADAGVTERLAGWLGRSRSAGGAVSSAAR